MIGAPLGNTNGVRHGLRMALPRLPKGCRHIQRQADNLRLALESALQGRARELGPYAAACIAAVAKWQRHGSLAARWLRQREAELSDADRLRYSEAVARAADSVVRLMEKLGLDKSDQDSIFDALYGPTPAERIGNGEGHQAARMHQERRRR